MKERWMSTSPKVKPWHGDGGKGCCVKNKKECTKGNTMMTEDNPFFFPQVDSSSLVFLSPLHLLAPLFFLLSRFFFNSTLLFSQNTHSSSIPTLLDTHSPHPTHSIYTLSSFSHSHPSMNSVKSSMKMNSPLPKDLAGEIEQRYSRSALFLLVH